MGTVRLAAALIVKDEEANLPACLESLRPLVDEVVVYDTGSSDGSVELAERAGARVQRGYWDGDFARARNAALELTAASWVLSVDADERAVGDRGALLALLDGCRKDVLGVRIANVVPMVQGGGHEHPAPRLLRRGLVRWTARLHEHPVRRDGDDLRKGQCPRDVLRLDHLGYADAEAVAAKVRRNQEIAQAQLDDVVAHGVSDPELLPRILLNLGRSHVAAGEPQRAADALETLRELAPGTPQAVEATMVLAELLARHGPQEAVFVLADELAALGAQPQLCDWLRAQALMALGRPEQALPLLRGIDGLVDVVGRSYDLGRVLMLQSVAAEQAGQTDEAAVSLLIAMIRYGRPGEAPRLLRLWAGRPPSLLARVMLEVEPAEHLDAVLAELRALGGLAAQLAATVGAGRARHPRARA